MGERPIRLLGLVAALAAALGALFVDNDLEATLFMAAAVIAALAAFDVSLDRPAEAFWPWMLVAAAILAKTIPSVVARLLSQAGPSAERTLHLGGVLFGLCLVGAVTVIAASPAGSRHRGRLLAMIPIAGIAAGLAAAAAAFAGRGGFATVRAARIFETLGWMTAGAVVMGVVLAASLLRVVTPAFVLLAIGMLAGAVLVGRTASGERDDLGWWALAFVVLASGALTIDPATLGNRAGRRRARVPAIAGLIGGALCLAAAFVALRGDGSTGFAIAAGVASLALAGIGASMLRGAGTDLASGDLETAAVTAPATPPGRGEVAPTMTWVEPPEPAVPTAPAPSRRSAFSEALSAKIADDEPRHPLDAVEHDRTPSSAAAPATSAQGTPGAVPPSSPAAPTTEWVIDEPATTTPAPAPAEPAMPAPAPPEPARAEPVLPVMVPPTSSLPAHLVDPQTGLQSAAGLQQGLTDAFSRPRAEREVSVLMVALGNLDEVEAQYGRIAARQAIAELGRRFEASMAGNRVARFANDGFAALLDGPALATQPLVERCTSVLVDLLDPVRVGTTDIEIDVAAGLAQCHHHEDIASFLGRANQGLAQAAAAGEPTLIAMP